MVEEQKTEEMTEDAEVISGNDPVLKEDTGEQNTETPETPEDAPETVDSENAETDAAPEDVETATDAAEQPAGKKSFFKKKKDKKDEQIEELTDRVKRTMAEFDNFRKRTEKEKAAMFEVGVKSVFEKLLPIVDNFERGLATLEEEQRQEPFPAGMDKTYQLLLKLMEEMEVKPIEAVGQEFDPNLHNAVMHVDDEEAGENIVVEEFQKGYLYRDGVLRHSMVKVAN